MSKVRCATSAKNYVCSIHDRQKEYRKKQRSDRPPSPLLHSTTQALKHSLALAVYVTPSQHIDRIGSELRHSVLTMRRDGAAPPIGQGSRTYPTVGHGSRVKRWLYRAMAHHVIHHLSKVSGGGSVVQPLKRNPRGAPRLSG